jgi:phosphoglycerate dehydrogenase-like enzyme
VRSRTKVKKEIIETGKRLKVIGRVGVGLGNIGEKVAIIAKAFGMKILITKRTLPAPALLKELEAEFIPLQELLREATLSLFMFPILGKLII